MELTVRELALDGLADAVPQARRTVRAALAGTPVAGLVADAELVASELATNALLHGVPPVTLRVAVGPGQVRIEVADGSPSVPVLGTPGPDRMTGRGMGLVTSLAAQWGIERLDAGKVVWAELTPGSEHATADATVEQLLDVWSDVEDERLGAPRFIVSLGDVPTDLLLAAKAHVDNVVREFALAASGAASGATAEIPAHLAHLIETVTDGFAEARLAIKQQALLADAAGDARTRLTLRLPASAADGGLEYLAAMDEVDAYARAARLLTIEAPPEHRAFRRWYVSGLVTQLRYAVEGGTPPPSPTFERFIFGELRELANAQRASERAARLQAVTAALASATTAEDVASVVVSEGVAALGASGGSLLVPIDDLHLGVPGAVGYPHELVDQLRAERRDALLPAATALRTGEPVWLESPQERDLRFPGLTGMEPATVSMCAVPLVVAGELLGALRFSFSSPRLFDDAERRFVLSLGAQTAQAMQRADLLLAERAARARSAFLAEAVELLTSSLEPEETLDHLTALLVPAMADWAVVYLREEHGPPRAMAVAHKDARMTARMRKLMAQRPFDMEEPAGPSEVMRVPLITRSTIIGTVALARTADHPYSWDDEQLVVDVAARAAVAVVNAQSFQRERDTAITLQHALLPQRPPSVAGAVFAWRYRPAGRGTAVGGDWYDVIDLEEGRVALVIGDVMGRGVHAAAVMGQLRATVRAYASAELAPAEILTRLDAAVARLEQAQITTAAFGVLDPADRTLTIASAGHLPPLLVSPDGDADYVVVEPGPPLGTGLPAYPETTVTLVPGAMLLLYTDGLVEDRDRPVDVGMKALREAVAGAQSAEAVCDRALAAMAHPERRDDDTAMLAVALDADVRP